MTAPIYALANNIELIAEIVLGFMALVSVIYCVQKSRSTQSLLPMYYLIGGGLCAFYEPYADVLGLAIYPEIDTHVMLDMLGRKIPWFVGLIYLFYFPIAFVYLHEKITQGYPFKVYCWFCFITIASACVFEILPVHFGLWTYYGAYVDKIHGFPMVWGFLNGQSVICGSVVLYLIAKQLSSSKQWLIILCTPLVFFGVHFAAAMPLYSVLNTTANPTVVAFGTVVSCLISVCFCWFFGCLVCEKKSTKLKDK